LETNDSKKVQKSEKFRIFGEIFFLQKKWKRPFSGNSLMSVKEKEGIIFRMRNNVNFYIISDF
jgi:hypothetical protein